MASSSAVGRIIKRPVVLGLGLLLILFIAGFAGNFFLGQQKAASNQVNAAALSDLRGLSESLAKHALAAAEGQLTAFPSLAEQKQAFANGLATLRASGGAELQNTVGRISSLWSSTSAQVDVVIAGRESTSYVKDISSDFAINMSAIQQENNQVVAEMLRLGLPANQVALAQRQSLLGERMSRTVDRLVQFGAAQNLTDNLQRDTQTFNKVLAGLQDGDRDLLLTPVANAGIQTSLATIEELFRTVSSQINEIQARVESLANVRKAAAAIYAGAADYGSAIGAAQSALQQNNLSITSPFVGLLSAVGALVVIFLISALIYREANQNVSETEVQNEQNQAAILQLLDELADLADGDLRVQATVTESFTGAIADSINFSIDQLRSLVSQINETSGAVSSAADQTQNSVNQLSEAAKRQAEEIAQVSEAVNGMAVSIDQVSYNAAESSSVAERSVEIANKGASVVQNTIDGMDNIRGQIQETAKRIKRLGESSQEIGDIVSLINDIADQTNILSLNAAIQASMAGDAGKGFAVVADEVQRLAERSGAAAKQISALVKTIQSDTNEAVTSMEQTTSEVVRGTRLAQDAGVALGEIESVSSSLAEIIENISDAARQQAASAGKISNTMKSIEDITSQTTEGTQATVVAVGNLAEITNELRSSVTGFKLPG
jgi:twitching motility protein PilJ